VKPPINKLSLADVKHMMEFLKQCTSLKKPLLEHYFINFLKDLSNEDFVMLCGLLTIEIGKPKRKLHAIPVGGHGSHNTKETKSSNCM